MSWSIDYISDLPLCNRHNAIFNCIDPLNKYCRLIPCFMEEGALRASSVAMLLFDNVVRFFGVPAEVTLDRHPRFTSSFW